MSAITAHRDRVVRLDTPLDALSFDELVRADDAFLLVVSPVNGDGSAT